jgi:hypothetical protein
MMIALHLRPEIEASLAQRARACGVSLEAYVQSIVEGLAVSQAAPSASLEEFRATLDELAEMGGNLPAVPSDAFTRESIYPDQD